MTSRFEHPGVWDASSGREAQRIQQTLSYVPGSLESALDVACGDGRCLRALAPLVSHCVGVDLAWEALTRVQGPRVRASITQLPFLDGSFDLVLATEVFEHLSEAESGLALAEVARVSRKWVLITVPYRENLAEEMCRCDTCRVVFHSWGHLRSFDAAPEGAPHLDLERMGTIVPIKKARRLPPLYWMQQRVGGLYTWDSTARCPRCSGPAAPRQGNLLGGLVERVIGRIDRLLPKVEPGWIAALFRKHGSQLSTD
jgi:SAM-dependent methyltransferase